MNKRIMIKDVREVPLDYIAAADMRDESSRMELGKMARAGEIRSYKVEGKSGRGAVYIHPDDVYEYYKKIDLGSKENGTAYLNDLADLNETVNNLVIRLDALERDLGVESERPKQKGLFGGFKK